MRILVARAEGEDVGHLSVWYDYSNKDYDKPAPPTAAGYHVSNVVNRGVQLWFYMRGIQS